MNTSDFNDIRLAEGERFHAALDRGTVVRVSSGAARLIEPFQWLGGVVISTTHTLAEGDEFRMARSGWIEIEALRGDVHVMHGYVRSRTEKAAHSLAMSLGRTVGAALKQVGLSRP